MNDKKEKIILKDIRCPMCGKRLRFESYFAEKIIDVKSYGFELSCSCGCIIKWNGTKKVVIDMEDWPNE